MGFPRIVEQTFFETPPRSHAGGAMGQVIAITVSTTAAYLDLRALAAAFGITYNNNSPETQIGAGAPAKAPQGLVGSFITVEADTADLGIITGDTVAHVTTTNVPSLAAVGTVSAGVYTPAAGTCLRIPAGQSKRFRLETNVDNFLAFVGSGAGTIRLYMSSYAGAAS